MSTFPCSPRLQRGALIAMDPHNLPASVVVFQYNPDTLTRTISPQAAGEGADKGEVLRLKAPPQETIKLDVEIDATDQLEQAKAPATSMGIYPTLASLEMMLYPKSAVAIVNEVLLNFGIIEVIPQEAPLTVFVWGSKRVVPVRLTDLSITEEAFDPNLNPIRAKASLSLRVLTYQDLGLLTPGGALFMAHQMAKEAMATIGGSGAIPTLPNTL
jgi:Contractile injection system tube protein